MINSSENVIEASHVGIFLGDTWVHRDVNLEVKRGEILGIAGDSGTGKTTLLREMLLLEKPTKGSLKLFGTEITTASETTLMKLRSRCGVLFQQNALFSGLTVMENVIFPLKEHTKLSEKVMSDLAMLKIIAAGLDPSASIKYPDELSGGMAKRAALARAMILDPEILFFDEPTAGLDPVGASALDELVLNLNKTLGLTIVIVTHDLDTLWRVTDRVAFLSAGMVLSVDSMQNLSQNPDPKIQTYLNCPRGRITREAYGKQN